MPRRPGLRLPCLILSNARTLIVLWFVSGLVLVDCSAKVTCYDAFELIAGMLRPANAGSAPPLAEDDLTFVHTISTFALLHAITDLNAAEAASRFQRGVPDLGEAFKVSPPLRQAMFGG